MKRRSFFKSMAIGGSAVAIAPVTTCSNLLKEPQNEILINIDSELDEYTIDQLQSKMMDGSLTAEAITQQYLNRIKELDTILKSVIELNPDALMIARKRDEERAAGNLRGPLHGIPIMIKDNIDTGDKMHTTAGSYALKGFKAQKDAFIVKQLRAGGAVLLGKTNLSEWANIRSTNSSSGWSGRGGQVRNPYILDRTPCGSSSGTGVAVAANLCTLGIGTETDGSVVCPSGINGIVGIKPTLGLWSRHGIIPISHSQDTAGPMARTVKDAASLLGALTGIDDYDPESIKSKGQLQKDYTSGLSKNALQGKRIGIIKDFFGFHAGVDEVIKANYDIFRNQGAELIEVECGKHRREWGNAEWTVLLYELKADMNKYLSEHPNAPAQSLQDLIDYNNAHPTQEMPWFGQEIFIAAQEKGDLNEEEYKEALKTAKSLSQKTVNETMEKHNLDTMIAPTNGPAWCIDWVNGDNFIGGTSDLAAVSGYPSITVPAGFVHGLPVGISFFGKAWSEKSLIEIAYAFEQASKHRRKPTFIPSLLPAL